MILCSAMLLRDSESGAGRGVQRSELKVIPRRPLNSILFSPLSETLPTKYLAPNCT